MKALLTFQLNIAAKLFINIAAVSINVGTTFAGLLQEFAEW